MGREIYVLNKSLPRLFWTVPIKKKKKNVSYVLKERISIIIVQYLPFRSSRSRSYKKERKRTLVTFFIKQKHPTRLKPTSKPPRDHPMSKRPFLQKRKEKNVSNVLN